LLSWIVITNHCALELMGPRAKAHTTGGCCHEPAKTPAKDGPAVPMVCCKTIKASLSNPSEGNLNGMRELAELTFATVQLNLKQGNTAPVVAIERGPPRVETFVERVLQSVLPSHAPPRAA
jgi:hypothetical protein